MNWTCYRMIAVMVVGLMLATSTTADESHEMPPYEGSSALQRIKTLAGDWKGVVDQPDGTKKEMLVTYRTTSNGSAVIETIMVGTPMEMTSVYFDRGGVLTMTHYCAVANRPTLGLIKEAGQSLVFDYTTGEEMDPGKDMHIHGLKLEFKSNNEIVQHWQGYEGGKPTDDTVMALKRVAAPVTP